MTTLGPKPKRVDIYVTRGLTWAKGLRISLENGTYLDLTGHAFVGGIRKTASSPSFYQFSFSQLSSTTFKWELLSSVSSSMPVGCNESDPASKYVYDIIWTRPGNDPVCIMKGVVTLNPKVT
jgi:hypothetical protein